MKSGPTWLCPEEHKFRTKRYFLCINMMNSLKKTPPKKHTHTHTHTHTHEKTNKQNNNNTILFSDDYGMHCIHSYTNAELNLCVNYIARTTKWSTHWCRWRCLHIFVHVFMPSCVCFCSPSKKWFSNTAQTKTGNENLEEGMPWILPK